MAAGAIERDQRSLERTGAQERLATGSFKQPSCSRTVRPTSSRNWQWSATSWTAIGMHVASGPARSRPPSRRSARCRRAGPPRYCGVTRPATPAATRRRLRRLGGAPGGEGAAARPGGCVPLQPSGRAGGKGAARPLPRPRAGDRAAAPVPRVVAVTAGKPRLRASVAPLWNTGSDGPVRPARLSDGSQRHAGPAVVGVLIDAVVPGRRAPRRYGAHDADGSSCVGGERPYDRTDIRRWSSWLENVNCP